MVVPTATLTMVIGAMDGLEELGLGEIALKKEIFDFLASPKTCSDDSMALLSSLNEIEGSH